MKTLNFKKSTFIGVLVLGFLFLIPQDIFSQGPPPWAPAHGYRTKTRHIYFPDQNFYYDVERSVYFYLDNGGWSISASLPGIYANVNLGRSRQVQLEIGGHTPYVYNEVHVVEYRRHNNYDHCHDHCHHHYSHHNHHKKYKKGKHKKH